MKFADLKAIHMIGKGLWWDSQKSRWMAHDSLATTSLLDLDQDGAADRVSLLLLRRAEKEGAAVNKAALNQPFFRLLPEERMILMILHRTEWNYDRVSRILGEDKAKVEELAWGARLHLAHLTNMNPSNTKKGPIHYPSGGAISGTHCPDYHPRRPWTQRFLDEELSKRELLFLQNHILGCRHCSRAVAMARDLYYSIEKQIPTWNEKHSLDAEVEGLQRALEKTRRHLNPNQHTFLSSLEVFLERWDVRIALVLLAAIVFRFMISQ